MRCLSAKRHWRNKLTRYYTTQLCPSRFAGLLRSRFSVKTRHETDEQSQLPMSTFGVPEASAKRRSEPPLFQKLADTHIDVGKPLQTHPPPTHFTLTRTPTSSHTFHERTLAHNSKRYPPPHPRATLSPPPRPSHGRSHKTPNPCPKISTKGTLTSTLSRYTRNICGNEKGTFDVNIRAPMSVMYRICKMHSAPTKKRTSTSA